MLAVAATDGQLGTPMTTSAAWTDATPADSRDAQRVRRQVGVFISFLLRYSGWVRQVAAVRVGRMTAGSAIARSRGWFRLFPGRLPDLPKQGH